MELANEVPAAAEFVLQGCHDATAWLGDVLASGGVLPPQHRVWLRLRHVRCGNHTETGLIKAIEDWKTLRVPNLLLYRSQ